MKELYEKTPFRRRLKPLKDYSYLASLDGSDSIVRFRYIGRADQKEKVINCRPLFEELNTKYDISVPTYDIVFGYYIPEKIPVAYCVTERIHGKLLSQAKIPENDARKLFNSLFSYYEDKYRNGGNFLTDINIDQFMYGKTRSDPQPKVYFVDLDPFYGHFDNTKPGEENDDLSTSLYLLADLLLLLEKNLGFDFGQEKIKFTNFLIDIIDSLDKDSQRNIKSILKELPIGY